MSVLLSWYGMSDYRAMTGQSETNGPVLSALLECRFSDLYLICPIDGHGTENSRETHNRFLQWFTKRLAAASVHTNINLVPACISDLNDLNGIREAERAALRLASNAAADGDITVYISPGTTLMAFAWAEAIREQNLSGIKLLVSPRADGQLTFIKFN